MPPRISNRERKRALAEDALLSTLKVMDFEEDRAARERQLTLSERQTAGAEAARALNAELDTKRTTAQVYEAGARAARELFMLNQQRELNTQQERVYKTIASLDPNHKDFNANLNSLLADNPLAASDVGTSKALDNMTKVAQVNDAKDAALKAQYGFGLVYDDSGHIDHKATNLAVEKFRTDQANREKNWDPDDMEAFMDLQKKFPGRDYATSRWVDESRQAKAMLQEATNFGIITRKDWDTFRSGQGRKPNPNDPTDVAAPLYNLNSVRSDVGVKLENARKNSIKATGQATEYSAIAKQAEDLLKIRGIADNEEASRALANLVVTAGKLGRGYDAQAKVVDAGKTPLQQNPDDIAAVKTAQERVESAVQAPPAEEGTAQPSPKYTTALEQVKKLFEK